jgi:hypothetical protein
MTGHSKRGVVLLGWITTVAAIAGASPRQATAVELSAATFTIDVTPPLGSPLCDALVKPASAIDDSLSARGIVLAPQGQQPIVIVAVDWVGIGNGGHREWRRALAEAAGTTHERVAVHTLHQHDAPGCDFDAERLASEHGLGGKIFDPKFAHKAIDRAAAAVRDALARLRPVTHLSAGQGRVEQVASTRRCLGPDGKVQFVRYTACTDPKVRDYPEGTIDPMVKVVSFWSADEPIAVLTYYATHPQSYYGQGRVSADFPGLARSKREAALPGPMHIHFNGAGGNLGAGKYNDGSPANRALLAGRLAAGMAAAWDAAERLPVADADVQWDTREVALPPAPHLDEDSLLAIIDDASAPELERIVAVRHLTWLRRCRDGGTITISRLRIGKVDLLHLPGELFVEYQLAAQAMRPGSLVCTAAYGDYGPGYIGLAKSYAEGGYETSARASRVAPGVESVLTKAIAELMK